MTLLLLALACGSAPQAPAPQAPAPAAEVPAGKARHAVVIVVDTLRADAVERARTPTLDRLAATGGQSGWAWSASTWTAPSMVSLFAGTLVRQHGWDFPFPNIMAKRDQAYPPLPERSLLAEVLRDAGFHTSAHYANSLLGNDLGYERGFQTWKHGNDEAVTKRARAELATWDDSQREFLYLHLFGPHHPLRPGKQSRLRWGLGEEELGANGKLGLPAVRKGGALEEQAYWRAYHAVVEDTDARLGRILEALQPHLDDTVLVITSDHGELLGEQGRHGHSMGVWEPLTRVPLLVKNGPMLPDRVSTAAVADLVTDAVGLDHPWPVQLGASSSLVVQREGAVALTVDGRSKAIWDDRAYETPVSMDLVADPSESHPLQPVSDDLLQARQAFDAAVPATQLEPLQQGMGEEMSKALRALGYLD